MIASRHITKTAAVLMTVAVLLCLCATGFSAQLVSAAGGVGVTMEYESKLFDTSQVLEVNIIMDEADWQAMLDNAMSEEYVQCDVQIAGETFYRVGIRPKGNTSLSTIVSDPTTDRYSFKLEFDQYVNGQTCYGLDKLILNNNYADATNMKEALIYDMFAYVGADASLYNYARVSVNGEYWGVYLALEGVEDSFMLRNYGTEDGELYKPDSMNIGGGGGRGDMADMGGFDMGDMNFEGMDFGNMDFGNMQPPENSGSADAEAEPSPDADTDTAPRTSGGFQRPESGGMPDTGSFDFSEMSGGGFGGGMFGGGGSNLNYSNDDVDSYSTIWAGEVTNTGDSDHKRVVTALKNISQGTDLEKYMDIDNLVKYAAVHIFSVNSDSLSGSMAHNYYLYETDGKLNILPWDYNLAFGGMGMGGGSGATDTVNSAIDDAWSSTNFFDTLMADEEYHGAYYEYMAQVVEYIQGSAFEEFYTHTRSLIDTLVETDPNAFYTYEEYLTAAETLYEFVTLRGQSIAGQLDGSLPSTESGQRSSDTLIDASHIDLSVMGSMSMGGGGGMDFGGRGDAQAQRAQTTSSSSTPPSENGGTGGFGDFGSSGGFGGFGGSGSSGDFGGFDSGELPEGFEGMDPSQFGGQMPEGMDPSQFGGQIPGFSQSGDIAQETPEEDQSQQSQSRPSTGSMSGMNFGGQSGAGIGTLLTYGISAVLMLAAFLFALFYRRRPRKR